MVKETGTIFNYRSIDLDHKVKVNFRFQRHGRHEGFALSQLSVTKAFYPIFALLS